MIEQNKSENVREATITRQQKDAELYQILLNNRKAYIIKTDAEANYTYANDLFLTRFGLDYDTIIGTSSMDSIYVAILRTVLRSRAPEVKGTFKGELDFSASEVKV